MIETHKLGKSYGRFAANAEIDFHVQPGELRAVIGPNGAGKTTFFNVLAGTTEATTGSIRFKDRDITEYAYQRGAVSLLDFLDAERNYRATQLAYRQALASYLLSLEQLRQAVGTRALP